MVGHGGGGRSDAGAPGRGCRRVPWPQGLRDRCSAASEGPPEALGRGRAPAALGARHAREYLLHMVPAARVCGFAAGRTGDAAAHGRLLVFGVFDVVVLRSGGSGGRFPGGVAAEQIVDLALPAVAHVQHQRGPGGGEFRAQGLDGRPRSPGPGRSRCGRAGRRSPRPGPRGRREGCRPRGWGRARRAPCRADPRSRPRPARARPPRPGTAPCCGG